MIRGRRQLELASPSRENRWRAAHQRGSHAEDEPRAAPTIERTVTISAYFAIEEDQQRGRIRQNWDCRIEDPNHIGQTRQRIAANRHSNYVAAHHYLTRSSVIVGVPAFERQALGMTLASPADRAGNAKDATAQRLVDTAPVRQASVVRSAILGPVSSGDRRRRGAARSHNTDAGRLCGVVLSRRRPGPPSTRLRFAVGGQLATLFHLRRHRHALVAFVVGRSGWIRGGGRAGLVRLPPPNPVGLSVAPTPPRHLARSVGHGVILLADAHELVGVHVFQQLLSPVVNCMTYSHGNYPVLPCGD